MASKRIPTIAYRRKREGKTHYKKRLNLLKSRELRLVVRKSLKNIVAQVVEYKKDGDHILFSAHSRELRKNGWKPALGNVPSAYLVGLLVGKKAKAKGVKKLILDTGVQKNTKGSRIYAVAKGVVDSGIKLPISEEILPSEERVSGKNIEEYAKKLKGEKAAYEKQFSFCLKNSVDPEQFSKYFEETKKKIMGA